MNQKLKKYVYVSLFVLLGIIINFLVHGVLELAIIDLLTRDFARYGLGLSWKTWFSIHTVGSSLLFIGFSVLGFWQGMYWWRQVYGETNDTSGE